MNQLSLSLEQFQSSFICYRGDVYAHCQAHARKVAFLDLLVRKEIVA